MEICQTIDLDWLLSSLGWSGIGAVVGGVGGWIGRGVWERKQKETFDG